jgi:hypothetical protein
MGQVFPYFLPVILSNRHQKYVEAGAARWNNFLEEKRKLQEFITLDSYVIDGGCKVLLSKWLNPESLDLLCWGIQDRLKKWIPANLVMRKQDVSESLQPTPNTDRCGKLTIWVRERNCIWSKKIKKKRSRSFVLIFIVITAILSLYSWESKTIFRFDRSKDPPR